jgi:uncharacterized damage-inducible protein DinB
MKASTQLAKHLRDVFFGGNWTTSNAKDQLADVTWQQAITQVQSLNTIATLAFHISYFIPVVAQVLQGGPLEGNDKLSFAHPPINSQEDWDQFQQKILSDAEACAALIEKLPDEKLFDNFAGMDKYGNYYRNILGIIEHTHYHLGQIAIIKKLITNNRDNVNDI